MTKIADGAGESDLHVDGRVKKIVFDKRLGEHIVKTVRKTGGKIKKVAKEKTTSKKITLAEMKEERDAALEKLNSRPKSPRGGKSGKSKKKKLAKAAADLIEAGADAGTVAAALGGGGGKSKGAGKGKGGGGKQNNWNKWENWNGGGGKGKGSWGGAGSGKGGWQSRKPSNPNPFHHKGSCSLCGTWHEGTCAAGLATLNSLQSKGFVKK